MSFGITYKQGLSTKETATNESLAIQITAVFLMANKGIFVPCKMTQ